jgi:serine/threonine protein kinase
MGICVLQTVLPILSITLIVVMMNLTPTNDYDHRQIHITDFGIAFVTQLANPLGGHTLASGCIEYMAPEVYHHRNIKPTTMSDMWTVGIIGYEMCLGEEVAWTTENFQEIKRYLLAGQQLNLWRIPARFGPNVRHIIHTCMALDPTLRFTAATLREFINSNFVIMKAKADSPAQNFSFMNSDWS